MLVPEPIRDLAREPSLCAVWEAAQADVNRSGERIPVPWREERIPVPWREERIPAPWAAEERLRCREATPAAEWTACE